MSVGGTRTSSTYVSAYISIKLQSSVVSPHATSLIAQLCNDGSRPREIPKSPEDPERPERPRKSPNVPAQTVPSYPSISSNCCCTFFITQFMLFMCQRQVFVPFGSDSLPNAQWSGIGICVTAELITFLTRRFSPFRELQLGRGLKT